MVICAQYRPTRENSSFGRPSDRRTHSAQVVFVGNIGYAIAEHIAEKLDGQLWEAFLIKRLFCPLKITAGQDPTGENQPWLHDDKGVPLPLNSRLADNPPCLGPAGRIHAVLID